jgi:aminoglycoside N3'-acetyltransferase
MIWSCHKFVNNEHLTPSHSAHVTKSDIITAFESLGLQKGMTVLVHSSLSAFGFVEGGADAVIDSILETIGPDGTLIMPTYSVNRRRIHDEYEEILPFDPFVTPVWTGIIPEVFRSREGVIRSNHPTHSLAAKGPKASHMIKSINQIYLTNGHVLLIGAGLEVNSIMHLAETIAKPRQFEERVQGDRPRNIKTRITINILLTLARLELKIPCLSKIMSIGRDLRNKRTIHSSNVYSRLSRGPWVDFAKMEAPYLTTGVMNKTRVGNADLRFMRVRPMIEMLAAELRKNADAFYSYRLSTYDAYLAKKLPESPNELR